MDETQIITIPKTDEIEVFGQDLLMQARQLEVVDHETLSSGSQLLAAIKTKVMTFKPGLDAKCLEADNVHSFLTTLRGKVLKPYQEAERAVKDKMADYHFQQQEKRRKEMARLEEKARQEAEKARNQAILEAQKAGDRETAKELKKAPIIPQIDPSKLKTQEIPKLAGASFRMEWDFEIVDINALPRRFMIPDESAIRKVVKALGKECGIAGIIVNQKTITVNR